MISSFGKTVVFGALVMAGGLSPFLHGQGRSATGTAPSREEAGASNAQAIQPPPGWTSRQEGEAQVLSPSEVPDGGFVMKIEPAEELKGRDFEAWFQSRVDLEITRSGGAGSRGTITRNGDRMIAVAVAYRGVTVLHSAVRRADGAVQFATIQTNLTAAQAQRHMAESGLMLSQLLTGNGRRGDEKSPATAPSASEGPTGPGVPPEAIEAVLHEGVGTTTAWGFAYVETVHLLLKDGWDYRGLEKSPSDLDVSASRRLEPQKWRHWRKAGRSYEIQENGTWRALAAEVARPLEPGSGLSAVVQYSRGYSAGGMGGSVFSRSFSFSPNGRFERSNSALHGTGAVQAGQGVSGGAAASANRQGRSAAGGFSGGAPLTGRFSTKSNAGAADMAGTYRIAGYTLELHCDSGKVERLLAFYPDPRDRSGIYLGDATYLPPRR
jgi:hypothetical protein